jgi:hypothetical protein
MKITAASFLPCPFCGRAVEPIDVMVATLGNNGWFPAWDVPTGLHAAADYELTCDGADCNATMSSDSLANLLRMWNQRVS